MDSTILLKFKSRFPFYLILTNSRTYPLCHWTSSRLYPTTFFFSILIVALGVSAARSLYFVVMEKGQIPIALTGTAVGLISLIGYTHDIFAGPIMGYLLDSSPGIRGHQHVFWMVVLFSLIGGTAAWYYYRLYGSNKVKSKSINSRNSKN